MSQLLLVGVLAVSSSTPAPAADVRYSDTEFEDADWSVTPEVVGGVGTALATHWSERGFPGACVHVEHRVTKNPDALMATMYAFHAHEVFRHNPARDGVVLEFDFSMFGLKSRAGAVSVGPAVRQGGVVFYGPYAELSISGHGGIAVEMPRLAVRSFHSPANPGLELDTSPLGGEIQLGFFTASGTTLDVTRLSETELDNWVLVVRAEQPVSVARPSWGRIRRLYR